MSSSDRQSDRSGPDLVDIQQVYERLDIDSTDELEVVVTSFMKQRGWESYEPTPECRRDLVRSFEDAFIDESGRAIVPEAVDAALEDASHWVHDGSQSPDSSVDAEIVPRLVESVGQMVPAYASRGLSTVGTLSVSDHSR